MYPRRSLLSSLFLLRSPGSTQVPDDVFISSQGCESHCCPTPLAPDVELRPGLVEVLDDVCMSTKGCLHHSSLPEIVPDVDVGAGLVEILQGVP